MPLSITDIVLKDMLCPCGLPEHGGAPSDMPLSITDTATHMACPRMGVYPPMGTCPRMGKNDGGAGQKFLLPHGDVESNPWVDRVMRALN